MAPRLTEEPAVLLISLAAPFVQTLLLAFTNLSPEVQAAWNALAVAMAGGVTAWVVARERLLPALLGAAQAVVALLAVHGWGLSAEQATGLTAAVALFVGQFVRTQVTAIEPLRIQRPDVSPPLLAPLEPTPTADPLWPDPGPVEGGLSAEQTTWIPPVAPEVPTPEPAATTQAILPVEPLPEPPERVTVDELLRKYRPQPADRSEY